MSSSPSSSVEVSQKDFKALERMAVVHDRTIRAQTKQIQDLQQQVSNFKITLAALQSAVSRLR